MKKIISLMVLLTITSYAYTTTINIPTDYSTIQAGIDAASDYDTVLVDSGTYVENINFNGKNITVASLFLTTQDTSYISQTVIDGDSSGSVVTFDSAEDSTTVLAGFTITNGYAQGDFPDNAGGGIYCHASSPSLENVRISDNTADYGGGISCHFDSSPSLSYVTISNNTAGSGGGIFCNNSSPRLKKVTISYNATDLHGGGISSYYNSSPSLENVTISNNTAGYYGGGISCHYNSNPSLENVTIKDNSANHKGGGIYCWSDSSPSIENVTISNNTAVGHGGGIYCYESSPTLVNTIVSNNMGYYGIYVESGDPSIEYCDFYNNENGNFYGCNQYIGQIVTTNANGDSCDVYFNIQMEPCFVDTVNGDYHLTENSPCIDAGDPNSPLDPDGTIADMGAYYYDQGQAVDDEPEYITQNSFISYPNPMTAKSSEVNISFSLKKSSRVNIKLYNIKGQLVTEILNDNKPSGIHTITSKINKFASGIYFIKMDVDGKNRAVKKMVKIE